VSQNHLTLAFPLKTPSDTKVLTDHFSPMMPALFEAEDAIGTVHYSRFTVLSDKTFLFVADFDGEFGQLMLNLAKLAGPLFEWAAEHLLHPLTVFTAYSGVTAREIKALAADAAVESATQQLPFLVILPTRSRLAFIELQLLLRTMHSKVQRDLAAVGTPHFAQFVSLEDNQVGFFTVYDGSFDKYIADFTKNIGEVFDLIFKFTKDPPPSPCRRHLQEFIDFAASANRAPIGFYQAYPGLSVQDIHALVADREAGDKR